MGHAARLISGVYHGEEPVFIPAPGSYELTPCGLHRLRDRLLGDSITGAPAAATCATHLRTRRLSVGP